MIGQLSQSGHTRNGITEYVLDTEADLKDLPIDLPIGSVAFIIETGTLYMFNSKREWIEV